MGNTHYCSLVVPKSFKIPTLAPTPAPKPKLKPLEMPAGGGKLGVASAGEYPYTPVWAPSFLCNSQEKKQG